LVFWSIGRVLMLTFGLIVEGQYDEMAIGGLIPRFAPADVEIVARPCGSKVQLMRRFSGFLEEFRYIKNGSHVDKALVVRDADGKDPLRLLETMRSKISGHTYPFPVQLVVIVEELEAWLLADEASLAGIIGKRVRRTPNPEGLHDPKEQLKRLLSEGKVYYTSEIARKIAVNANVDTLASRCPSFGRFRQAVIDC